MKTLAATLVFLFVASAAAFAADIDGKWKSERKLNRNGEEMTITSIFDLKADGAKLTGKVTTTTPMGERTADVSDGKIDGNKVTFSVTSEGRNGPMTIKYEATLDGTTLKGTAAREGAPQPMPFEAKKQ